MAWLVSLAEWFTAAGGVISGPETAGVGTAVAAAGEVGVVTIGQFLNVAAGFVDVMSFFLNVAAASVAGAAALFAEDDDKRARYVALTAMSNENWLDNVVNVASTTLSFATGNFVAADVLKPVVGAGVRFVALEGVNTAHKEQPYYDQISKDECGEMILGNDWGALPDNGLDDAEVIWQWVFGQAGSLSDTSAYLIPTDHSPSLMDEISGLAAALGPSLDDLQAKTDGASEHLAMLESMHATLGDGDALLSVQAREGRAAATLALESVSTLSAAGDLDAVGGNLGAQVGGLHGALSGITALAAPNLGSLLGGAMSWLLGGIVEQAASFTGGIEDARAQASHLMVETGGAGIVTEQLAALAVMQAERAAESSEGAVASMSYAKAADQAAATLAAQRADLESERSRVQDLIARQHKQYLDVVGLRSDLAEESDWQNVSNEIWRSEHGDQARESSE